MLYTYYKNQNTTLQQSAPITFEDILENKPIATPEIDYFNYKESVTINIATSDILKNEKRMQDIERYRELLINFAKYAQETVKLPITNAHYKTFYLTKANGKKRRIDEPMPELKDLQEAICKLFKLKLKVIPHNAAFAYTEQRSIKDAITVHQKNESKWFLKMDLKNFFPSCNKEFIMKQLIIQYPFTLIVEDEKAKEALSTIIDYALLNDSLPQGTPLSPYLTNLVMKQFDYELMYYVRATVKEPLVYTRYADDLLISCKYDFDWRTASSLIQKYMTENNYPCRVNPEKTRYGSSAGRNWNLGLMFNKDNKITIGHEKKKILKAMLNNFFNDLTNGNAWSRIETQALQGKIAFAVQIEPDYINYVISKYEHKYNKNFKAECKAIILA